MADTGEANKITERTGGTKGLGSPEDTILNMVMTMRRKLAKILITI